MKKFVGCLVPVLAIFAGNSCFACEPVWVRTVIPSSYDSAFVGKVDSVNWLQSNIVVTLVRPISGNKPKKAIITYRQWPWQCAHQSFTVGEIVDVFLYRDGGGWAQPPADINFGQRGQ